MPRFFLSPNQISENSAIIYGEDASHIARSLRMKVGDPLTLCDGEGMEFHCTITALSSSQVELSIDSKSPSKGEPPCTIHLYVALPKGDKMEQIVQKSVELGVTSITPVLTERAISRPDEKSAKSKVIRWQKIAREAAGQCGRGIIPTINPLVKYDAALKQMQTSELAFICYENESERTLKSILPAAPPKEIAFLTGAEGGFSQSEINSATAANIPTVSLGSRILRCETAPLYTLACILFHFE